MKASLRARSWWQSDWAKYLRPDVRVDFQIEIGDLKSGKRTSPTYHAESRPTSFERIFSEFEAPTIEADGGDIDKQQQSSPLDADSADSGEDDDFDNARVDDSELETPADEYFTLGTTHAFSGEHERAVGAFSRALELDADDFEALFCRAESQVQLGHFMQAIDDCSRCLVKDPRKSSALSCRAYSFLELTRYKEALDDLNAALRIAKFDGDYFLRGLAYFGLGDHERALRDLTTAIQKGPQCADYYLGRSRVFEASGETNLAEADLAESIRRNPDFAEIQIRATRLASRLAAGQ